MMYTSRYSNPELRQNHDKYLILSISVGTPRWMAHNIDGAINELKPFGLLNIHDKHEYRKQYIARLNEIGVDKLARVFESWQQYGKPLVLCCYEDVRKMGDNWCHRTMFAKWWQQQTGEQIDELHDPSRYKLEPSEHPFLDILEG